MPDRNPDEMSLSEVIRLIEELDATPGEWTEIKVAVLANVTMEPVLPYFKFLCYQDGLRLRPYVAGYDTVMQEVLNDGSALYEFAPDIVIVCLAMENLSESLASGFATLTAAQVAGERERVLGFVRQTTEALRKRSRAVILLHNFPPPALPVIGLMDAQDADLQGGTYRRLNASLVDVAREMPDCHIVDLERVRALLGHRHFNDPRYWHLAKAPYTRAAWQEIAKEYAKFIRAIRGKTRKCLVLDCDNTLWGGIVGEDGLAGIRIGPTYPGSAYAEFQAAILQLHARGVMLALCSKNNETDVLEVLQSHPDMRLRREHFAAVKVNWADKVANLKAIAADLNVGLDSLVFCDDSEFEINLVRAMLPEVQTLKLPTDPALYRDALLDCGWFDTLALSDEDRARTALYRAEEQRKAVKEQYRHGSLGDYLRDLAMTVTIRRADAFAIPRIAQLTQRTNQFNLTTRRYTEGEIRAFAGSSDAEVLFLQLKDRFGDLGIVGAAILKYAGGDGVIDSLLLSCRAIGRGAEHALLAACVRAVDRRGCRRLVGEYVPTAKNAQVADFYARSGFTALSGKTYALAMVNAATATQACFCGIVAGEEKEGGDPVGQEAGA